MKIRHPRDFPNYPKIYQPQDEILLREKLELIFHLCSPL